MPSEDPLALPRPVLPARQPWPLHDIAQSRRIEAAALAVTPAHALMQHAGLALARLAQALAPQGASVWVAAGPGNNGGDGLAAAMHLQRWGRDVQVSWLGDEGAAPADALDALQRARAAGVRISAALPSHIAAGLCIDALLGLGARRAPAGALAAAIDTINRSAGLVLAADLPSGLSADSGQLLGQAAVRAHHTLSLLTLKPGLFTAQGRDHSGRVWLHALGVETAPEPPCAELAGPPGTTPRQHSQHKGSYGDVVVLGGAAGMVGAAVLAARAALTAGAGRVLVALLDANAPALDLMRPELMHRHVGAVLDPALLAANTVVCGCGGGDGVADVLPPVLAHAGRLVLDADGLNATAADPALRAALRGRAQRGQATVLTPHPLECARLLGCTTAEVQGDRLGQAANLANQLQCTVVLKGSGSVVATPGRLTRINPSGNARLATAGSGDVLAGWLGGRWSGRTGHDAHDAASAAVWQHGQAAEHGDMALPLRACDLIERLATHMAATDQAD